MPELIFNPALPWSGTRGGTITLKKAIRQSELLAGALEITITAGGEESKLATFNSQQADYITVDFDNDPIWLIPKWEGETSQITLTPRSEDPQQDVFEITDVKFVEGRGLTLVPSLPWPGIDGGLIRLETPISEQQFLAGAVKLTVQLTGQNIDYKLAKDSDRVIYVIVRPEGSDVKMWSINSWVNNENALLSEIVFVPVVSQYSLNAEIVDIWLANKIQVLEQNFELPFPPVGQSTGQLTMHFTEPVSSDALDYGLEANVNYEKAVTNRGSSINIQTQDGQDVGYIGKWSGQQSTATLNVTNGASYKITDLKLYLYK